MEMQEGGSGAGGLGGGDLLGLLGGDTGWRHSVMLLAETKQKRQTPDETPAETPAAEEPERNLLAVPGKQR